MDRSLQKLFKIEKNFILMHLSKLNQNHKMYQTQIEKY